MKNLFVVVLSFISWGLMAQSDFTVVAGENTASASGTFVDPDYPADMCDYFLEVAISNADLDVTFNTVPRTGTGVFTMFDSPSSSGASPYDIDVLFEVANCTPCMEPQISIHGNADDRGFASMVTPLTITYTGSTDMATIVDPNGDLNEADGSMISSGGTISKVDPTQVSSDATWSVLLPVGATSVNVTGPGGNRIEGIQFDVNLVPVCPQIGMIICDPISPIRGESFDVNVSGLMHIEQSATAGDEYDIDIVLHPGQTPPTDPYTGGTVLGTIPYASLMNNDMEGVLEDQVVDMPGGYTICAILNPAPTDPNCRPSVCAEKIVTIPTIGQWGIVILSLFLLIFGIVAIRKYETLNA